MKIQLNRKHFFAVNTFKCLHLPKNSLHIRADIFHVSQAVPKYTIVKGRPTAQGAAALRKATAIKFGILQGFERIRNVIPT